MSRAWRKIVECSAWRSAPKKCKGGWTSQVAYDVVLDCGHKRTVYGGSVEKKPTRATCREWRCSESNSEGK
jgi:hypothetical protein